METSEIVFAGLFGLIGIMGTFVVYYAKRAQTSIDKIGQDTGVLRTEVKVLSTQMGSVIVRQNKQSEKVNKHHDALISEGLLKPEGS